MFEKSTMASLRMLLAFATVSMVMALATAAKASAQATAAQATAGDSSPAKSDPSKKDDKKSPAIGIRAQLSRPAAIYKVDEPVTVYFASTHTGEVEYVVTADELEVLHRNKVRVVAGQTYKIEEKVDRPCFARFTMIQDSGKASVVAGIEPTKISPVTTPPDDFDEYWKAQRDELAKNRIDLVYEFWPSESTKLVNVYRVNFASVDKRRVYGWLAVPKGPGPFPAIVTMPHAGVYGIKPDLHHAELGAVSLSIVIHDFPVDHPYEFYRREAEGPLKNYTKIGWDDRDACYFRYAILAGVRAVDYLAGRKDVDPEQIAVTGVSQGGGLALCLSGFDDRVKFVASNMAGLCDLSARSKNRIDGWPHWLAVAPADLKDKIEATSRYFDAVNFARKFKGKSLHGVGFLDTVCPPSTVYAAFNQLPEPKSMIDSPLLGHSTDPRWLAARDEFWQANLKLKPPPLAKKK